MTDKLETITHVGTNTKMKTEFVRRNTDAPGAGKHELEPHRLKRRFHSPDIPEDFAAVMFHDAKTRMRTWKYIRSASKRISPYFTKVTFCMGLLTEKDSAKDKKDVHRVADVAEMTFVKE